MAMSQEEYSRWKLSEPVKTDMCWGCGRNGREIAAAGGHPDWCPTRAANPPNEHTKPSNPKDMLGIKRFAMSVLPWNVLAWVAIALLEGAFKYARHNYRAVGVRASIYFDANARHMLKFWEGEDFDPDIKFAKVHHVDKAIASLVVLSDSIKRGNWVDDRPPRCPDGWYQELDQAVEGLWKQYPNPKPPYTEVGVNNATPSGPSPSSPDVMLAAHGCALGAPNSTSSGLVQGQK